MPPLPLPLSRPGPGRLSGRLPSRLLALLPLLLATGCSDEHGALTPSENPCDEPPPALALGEPAAGALEAGVDCLADDGRLYDPYILTLAEPTAFTVTLSTEGYRPFMPLYAEPDGAQLSGWATEAASSLTREHLFPAGSYLLRSSSFERAQGEADPAEGLYDLSTAPLAIPQEGCGRETSVTYGSVVEARLGEDDCEAVTEEGDSVLRRSDGYDFLLRPGVGVEVTASADFPFRLAFWSNGQPVEVFEDVRPGQTWTVTAGGTGFLDFYVVTEEEGVGGSYLLTFEEATGSAAVAGAPQGSSYGVARTGSWGPGAIAPVEPRRIR